MTVRGSSMDKVDSYALWRMADRLLNRHREWSVVLCRKLIVIFTCLIFLISALEAKNVKAINSHTRFLLSRLDMLRFLRFAMTAMTTSRVPIPTNGVDYRGKIVLAPMVRSGELPSRLLALDYGADLVWGPETIDRALIGTSRRVNPRNGIIEFTRGQGSIIYRIDPVREKGRLVFQIGTASPELAVEAARIIAPDVSGIDVNSGCPKPFSTSGGMGAALLRTPDKLVSILTALVDEVGKPFQIGISVKIRILETPEETKALVSRLVKTGITGLTVHCRTTPMRPRERAIRDQLKMVADVCCEAGVACVMNGDVTSRNEGLALMKEYGVDGAMIATSAEANSSCFRPEGGLLPWKDVVHAYLRTCMEVENRFGNTKYLLNMLVPSKEFQHSKSSKSYYDFCHALGFDDLVPAALQVDENMNLTHKSVFKNSTTNQKQEPEKVDLSLPSQPAQEAVAA